MQIDGSFIRALITTVAFGMVVVGLVMAMSPITYLGRRNRIVPLWQKQPWVPWRSFTTQCRVAGIVSALFGILILRGFDISQ
jgi:hypothetical protein